MNVQCKFGGSKCNSNQKWNNNKCQCKCKNPKEHCVCKRVIFGILLHVSVKVVNIYEVLLIIP